MGPAGAQSSRGYADSQREQLSFKLCTLKQILEGSSWALQTEVHFASSSSLVSSVVAPITLPSVWSSTGGSWPAQYLHITPRQGSITRLRLETHRGGVLHNVATDGKAGNPEKAPLKACRKFVSKTKTNMTGSQNVKDGVAMG